MNVPRVQASVSQRLASGARPRRRLVPPSSSVQVSQRVNQRWRERPRCPALRVTPGCRDGVVHAIVGGVAGRRFRAVNVQDERAAGVHVFASRFAGRIRLANQTEISSGTCQVYSRPKQHGCRLRSSRRTIALLMLPPCSASSMLSAPLRPGPWPGIRALTTPTRGTFQQLCDGRQPVDHSKMVDAGIAEAYVDIITSVPHGTPPVRPHGLRSAHSAGAQRARHRAQPPNNRRVMHDDQEWFVGVD